MTVWEYWARPGVEFQREVFWGLEKLPKDVTMLWETDDAGPLVFFSGTRASLGKLMVKLGSRYKLELKPFNVRHGHDVYTLDVRPLSA